MVVNQIYTKSDEGERIQCQIYQSVIPVTDRVPDNAVSDAECVLSGGQGSNENISEAEAMCIWLADNGIDTERLYLEDRSTSTKENLAFSQEVIETNDLKPDVVIITSGFHVYRAGLIADTLDMNHKGYGSLTAWWLMPTFAVREMYGILYQYVTQ